MIYIYVTIVRLILARLPSPRIDRPVRPRLSPTNSDTHITHRRSGLREISEAGETAEEIV